MEVLAEQKEVGKVSQLNPLRSFPTENLTGQGRWEDGQRDGDGYLGCGAVWELGLRIEGEETD